MKKVSLFILVLVVCCGIASAQPGTLDLSFGNAGKVIGQQFGNCYAMAVQKDGKIILSGNSTSFDGFFTARYLANGIIDASFGQNGTVSTLFSNAFSKSSLAIQKDGKIVVAGISYLSLINYNIFMVRYTADGRPDSSFGENSIVNTDLGLSEFCNDIAIQEDGKILAVGRLTNDSTGGYEGLLIVRYLSDGRVDASFGDHGKVVTNTLAKPAGTSIAVKADGKIICGGFGKQGILNSNNLFMIFQYDSQGKLDSSFGVTGIAKADFETKGNDNLNTLLIQPDGKIVAAGNTGVFGNSTRNFCAARYKIDGNLDTSFGINGKVITNFPGLESEANTISILPNNKIILGGLANILGSDANFAISYYLPDGKPDSSFGENGRVITDMGFSDWVWSTAVQPDGKILAAGQSFLNNPEPYNNFALARYNGDPVNQHPLYTKIKGWIRKHILNFEVSNPNADFFVIEKNSGSGFNEVTRINSNTFINNNSYSYALPTNNDNASYRIRAVSNDGAVSYSDAIVNTTDESTNAALKIFPNPAKTSITIQSSKAVTVQLQNGNGLILDSQKINGRYTMDINKLHSGIYYIVIVETGESYKVVKE